eukprot:gb/GFBE01006904.1/.p1 GENE.gb/GFBE01006904.1/~~gb/GFBE01006904.1/.p1  ORF type:complete len:222 (+),score=48.49 gb/GFBE01006904.1/:1-666(+)
MSCKLRQLVVPFRQHKRRSLAGLALIAGSAVLAALCWTPLRPQPAAEEGTHQVSFVQELEEELSPSARRTLKAVLLAIKGADVAANATLSSAADLCERLADAKLSTTTRSLAAAREIAKELRRSSRWAASMRLRAAGRQLAEELSMLSLSACKTAAESAEAAARRTAASCASGAWVVAGAAQRVAEAAEEVAKDSKSRSAEEEAQNHHELRLIEALSLARF